MHELQSKGCITKEAYDRLLQVCLEAKPREACGILASRFSQSGSSPLSEVYSVNAIVDTIIPITNTHINPTYAFSFDPAEWTAAYYDMQNNRQSLVGLFHSHPRTDAIPSSSDTEGFLPASELTYWIVSLKDIHAPQVKPYLRDQGVFKPLQLVFA
ncbi:M67 family metallopeptidase [Paenibacillus alkaliterrae]|uniref:Mov34/MPN/PAD-1 family protein n=1 Tax=Paenibacillus alkaliterrae TaxID=320909 RepID=UPI001F15C022|nr:M67 family metallopeptidase [Paenibacillus alkaliterrae]MCF2938803.1 M67 family metallopeptidase [Paenibacillus alkaliterrae]